MNEERSLRPWAWVVIATLAVFAMFVLGAHQVRRDDQIDRMLTLAERMVLLEEQRLGLREESTVTEWNQGEEHHNVETGRLANEELSAWLREHRAAVMVKKRDVGDVTIDGPEASK